MTSEQLETYLNIAAAHPIDGDNLRTVLGFPGFRQLERAHIGHTGPCLNHDTGIACFHYQVGIELREGTVEWFRGWNIDEAVRKAAAAIAKARKS